MTNLGLGLAYIAIGIALVRLAIRLDWMPRDKDYPELQAVGDGMMILIWPLLAGLGAVIGLIALMGKVARYGR